jgi:hypothetical protein
MDDLDLETLALPRPLFPVGQVVMTHGACEALSVDFKDKSPVLTLMLLARHMSGDYGDLDADDKAANTQALKYGGRIMSVYNLFNGPVVWIITESDRSSTTVLMPYEY